MKVLKLNDSGNDVCYLQRLLQEQGFTVKESGIFDSTTQQAAISFQCKHGLTADGITGFRTWESLLFEKRDKDMDDSITNEDYERIAYLLDIEPASIKAIQEVETGGKGGFFAPGKPAILFEGHIFWNQLKKRGLNPEQYIKGNENILFPKWDKSHYKKGLEEYTRLEQAKQINLEAAYCSASWGMFQIMGFNHGACGMKSVTDFVKMMSKSELSQLRLLAIFIMSQKSNRIPDNPSLYLISALRAKDWANFARLYNGPQYAQNNYDTKIATAYKKYASQQ